MTKRRPPASLVPSSPGGFEGDWPRRVVVTGAGGHLGGWIVSILASGGVDVTATAGPGEEPQRLAAELAAAGVDPARLRIVACDLLDKPCWAEIMAGQDALIHVAAPMPHVLTEDAAPLVACAREGSRRVVEAAAAAGIRRMVMTSSIMASLYGADRPDARVVTEADWSTPGRAPMTIYAEAKTVAERTVWDVAAERGLQTTVINPGIIFGPGLTSSISPSLNIFREILLGRAIVAPRILLPLVDVRDVAWLHVAALLSDAAIGERIFAVADQLWLTDLIDRIRASGFERLPVPRPIDDERARRLADSFSILSYLRFDIGEERWIARGKAEALLQLRWRPVATTISETIHFLAARTDLRHAA
ncbi:NAD-dependent epimerase/dehydratase family protein [Mesorhizobium sp. BR1-1-16]|uniref:NAD-dependent epimerase/dehydratase family protein n=1 Tax=Mesorhizobium sp. BR1-1-16 TaxID=2876653 RepID=UPI001CCAB48E|nr:NAD-dependent epimerase/dehydratase family protein [Mesorhizobium sp. BR1-1-16]MBZ9938739.1 NAD-dependent epimerase/dehydratase family protein [Mesorhizobium sp. BR1-1-16]